MLMQIGRFCSSIFLSHILIDKRGNEIFRIEILVLQFPSWEWNFIPSWGCKFKLSLKLNFVGLSIIIIATNFPTFSFINEPLSCVRCESASKIWWEFPLQNPQHKSGNQTFGDWKVHDKVLRLFSSSALVDACVA